MTEDKFRSKRWRGFSIIYTGLGLMIEKSFYIIFDHSIGKWQLLKIITSAF